MKGVPIYLATIHQNQNGTRQNTQISTGHFVSDTLYLDGATPLYC